MVTDSNELLGQALGTCTLQRLLGRGGMGAVYLARQSRPRRIVAVKVLLPGVVLEQQSRNEFLARFRREADAIAALDHINIMPVYEYGEQGDIAFLVMPYVTGGTLREVLEKRGVLSLEEVVPIIEQAAAGLDCAHAQTIVHRDLKPGNIIFHADGRILLADFGLAKVLKDVTDQENSQGHLTSVGTIVGTPEYLSPEQGTGDAIDYRTDVYSLGVVLYQMLAGRVPFTGTSPVAVAIKHTLEQPPPITRFNPQVPKNVEAVVMKAMAKSPSDRFDSAGMFAQALRQAVSEALGDHFPSSLPASAGEQFTPVYPLMQEKITETPAERHSEDDDMPTKITSPSNNNEPQTPNAHTVLMEEDKSHNNQTEGAPRLANEAQNNLQALPTVITQLDATIVDQPAPAALNLPLAQASTTETSEQPQSKGYTENNQPRQPITNAPVTERSFNQSERLRESERSTQWNNVRPAQQQMQGDRERQPASSRLVNSSTRSPRILALAIGVLALIIIIGSLATFLLNQKSSSNTQTSVVAANATATRAAISQKSTPASQTTKTSTLNPPYTLPSTVAPGAGGLIYETNYPGTCDPKGAKWQMVGIQAKCGPAQLRLTNPTSADAGAILTQLPDGASLPSSYYIQVQVTLNTPGSQFSIYYHRSTNAYYVYTVSSTSVASDYYSDGALVRNFTTLGIQNVTFDNTVTVDVLIDQGNFSYYINGNTEGTATSQYDGIDTGGNIGLTVGSSSDVSFKNLAIYNLQQ